MLVRELVGGEVVAVGPQTSIDEAAKVMRSNEVSALAVELDHQLLGILTERDLVKALAEGADLGTATAEEWMTEYPDTFGPEMGVSDAAEWMMATGYRHLPIVDDGRTIGMVSIKDVLWAMTAPDGG